MSMIPQEPVIELPAPPQSSGASVLVRDGFTTAQAYAQEAFGEATDFLTQMNFAAGKLSEIPNVDGNIQPIAAGVTEYVPPPVVPPPSGLVMDLPSAPSDVQLAVVSPLNVGAAPEFNLVAPNPDFGFAAPAPLTAAVPLAPTLPGVVIPTAAAVVLPDVPTLINIEVPMAPLLSLPVFAAVAPDSPLAPAFYFSFEEPTYVSTLLASLRAQLAAWVDGTSTGLPPAVEQAIWDRGRARENTLLDRKAKEAIRKYASRGFTKPPGALALEIADAMQDTQNTLSALSRDVMVKQADLEQTNRRFAFEQAWKVEEGLITYQNQIAQRAFETAKYAQQVAIDIYREQVAAYVGGIQAYAAKVEAFKAALTAELAKLDIYKSQLEGQKLIGELNVQAADIYKARVDATRALIENFRAQVEAANTAATVNKTLIEGFAAQVNAYGETVRAKAAEYQGYQTRVQAQVSIVDAYKAQADAFNSRVQGFRATVDAGVAAKNIEMKIGQELPLDVFKTRTEVYRTQVTAEAERVGAVVKTFEAQIQAFGAQVQGETARVGAEVSVMKADTELAVATGNLRIEAAKVNVQTLIQQANLLIEAIKAGAQVAAQLAAAALSSVNLSGQIGDHTSYAVGFNNSNSVSNSASRSGNSSDSTQTSTATQTSTSDTTYHYPDTNHSDSIVHNLTA